MTHVLPGRERLMTSLKNRHILLVFLAAMVANCSLPQIVVLSAPSMSSYYIVTEEFRWSNFPLKVYVDMNDLSTPDYAIAVREALDGWVKSIWNYTQTYNETSLPTITYLLYISDANVTHDYDVFLTFTGDNIPPNSNTVGLTTYSWDALAHRPIAPITINITTFSATATKLFVKNVVMHEFGHVLGLGHAYPSTTLNGPELMYYSSSKNQVVYPSTLDVYGLASLYSGKYNQNIQLPDNIPYVMLAEGAIPPPEASLWEDYRLYLPVLGVLLLLIIAAIMLSQLTKEKKHDEIQVPIPPPTPNN